MSLTTFFDQTFFKNAQNLCSGAQESEAFSVGLRGYGKASFPDPLIH